MRTVVAVFLWALVGAVVPIACSLWMELIDTLRHRKKMRKLWRE